MMIILLILCVFFILLKFQPVSRVFQFGSTEVQNDTKKADIGSLSNPYKIGDTVTLTIYEVQGYNYATGVRTVANPAEIKISIEAPLFESIGDVLDKLGYSTNNETIQKYSAQLYMNTDIYAGQTTRILVGGYESQMGITSIDELDLLKIDYFDKEGENNTVYISLHE